MDLVKMLQRRLAEHPSVSVEEEERLIKRGISDFVRLGNLMASKRDARRGLREAQARLAPRVIIYHQEPKAAVTSGAKSQAEVDDGGGGSTDDSSESEGDPDRPKKREPIFKKTFELLRRFSGVSR